MSLRVEITYLQVLCVIEGRSAIGTSWDCGVTIWRESRLADYRWPMATSDTHLTSSSAEPHQSTRNGKSFCGQALWYLSRGSFRFPGWLTSLPKEESYVLPQAAGAANKALRSKLDGSN